MRDFVRRSGVRVGCSAREILLGQRKGEVLCPIGFKSGRWSLNGKSFGKRAVTSLAAHVSIVGSVLSSIPGHLPVGGLSLWHLPFRCSFSLCIHACAMEGMGAVGVQFSLGCGVVGDRDAAIHTTSHDGRISDLY